MQDCRAIYSVHLPQRGKINLKFKNKKERAFLVHVDLKNRKELSGRRGGFLIFISGQNIYPYGLETCIKLVEI